MVKDKTEFKLISYNLVLLAFISTLLAWLRVIENLEDYCKGILVAWIVLISVTIILHLEGELE